MARAFFWSLRTDVDEGRVFMLGGAVDANPDFEQLEATLGAREVVDVSGIVSFTSVGVRDWMSFVRRVQGEGKVMEFVNCSLAFVTQMNMIIRFAGVMPVRSIQAPYRCPSCDRENVRVLDVRGDIAAQLNVRLPCVCGGRLEFDELLENYFAFLRPAAAPR